MKRIAVLLAGIWLSAACDGSKSPGDATSGPAPRNPPSVTEPGIHISGSARVGVVRRY